MYKNNGNGDFIVNPLVLLRTTTSRLKVKFTTAVSNDYVWDLFSV